MDEREVWRARKKRKSYALSSSRFLTALQISQVHHIGKKNACLLIVNLILVTWATEKQTLLLPGYKHDTIVLFERIFFFVKLTVKICLFIRQRSIEAKQKQR